MKRVAIVVGLAAGLGCPPPSRTDAKPQGTPTDPVTVCEQVGDVCKIGNDSQLGVCNKSTEQCPGPDPCFACILQH